MLGEKKLLMPNQSRQARRSSGAFGGVIVMGLVILVLTFVAWLYVHDAEPGWDEDLKIAAPLDLAPMTTAPQRLQAFLGSLQPVESAELAGREPWLWDTAALSRMLSRNAQALDNLKDLLEDFDWHGRHAAWHQKDLGQDSVWTYAAILKQVEIAYLDRRGEELAAFAAAIDLMELSRRLQDLHAWPSFYFRSLEMHERGVRSLAPFFSRCAAT